MNESQENMNFNINLSPNRGKSQLGRDYLRFMHPEINELVEKHCIGKPIDSKVRRVTTFMTKKGQVVEVIDYRGSRVIAAVTKKGSFSHEKIPNNDNSWVIFG